MGYSVPPLGRYSILRGTLYPIGHERSLSNRLRTWSHPRTILFVQIVFLHFNVLVRTLKSRCYFVYDVFAIVSMKTGAMF